MLKKIVIPECFNTRADARSTFRDELDAHLRKCRESKLMDSRFRGNDRVEKMLVQEEKTQLVEIAIPLPVQDPYTYRLPKHLVGQIRIGSRVRIPFRNRTIVGYAVGLDSQKSVEKPKDILEVLDQEPIVTDHFLRLAKWMSDYYCSSWGEAIANVLPKFLRSSGSERTAKKSAQPQPALTGAEIDAPFIRLNEEQEKACQHLQKKINGNRFSEILLLGVTGGGKSELYIRAIQETLKQGKSIICLVPEIALTEQIKLFFVSHFHEQLEIVHSKLTEKGRADAWRRIQSGEKTVILGVRSAVFAPTPQLGLMIMDEEQETSYKQDQTPRYHAREVARWRAMDSNAVFLMGTATPTLETMHKALSGEIDLLALSKRVEGRAMPEVKIIDLKQAEEITKRSVVISQRLEKAIEQALHAKKSILLMLNRRGFSTQIRCRNCNDVLFCPYCAVALTFHQEEQQVLCHYCNYHIDVPKICGQCKHPLFKFSGLGTEKVASEVGRLFPRAVVERLDADSTRKRGAHEQILTKFRSHQIDILVGTQMIAKGFDFQNVVLVGIVNADTGLLLPDFRSAERTFQLLTQMAGRTGRGKERGMVLIQTYSPTHYSIQFAVEHDYQGFYSEEIKRRQALNYPPFCKLINVMFRGKKEQTAREQAVTLRKLLDEGNPERKVELLGPAPLPLYRLRGHFRWHLMVRGADGNSMRKIVQQGLLKLKRKAGVYLAVDVDPVTIL